MFNKLKSVVSFSAPSKKQLQHDAWLIVVAFVGSFFAAWQVQPNKASKAAWVAAACAGFAAAVTVVKSICTTL
jgi:hypothetical protein